MVEFVKVATIDEIGVGQRKWVEFPEQTVVIFNIDGQLYCIADLCTHDGGPLEEGVLEGCEIECPRHGARFDVRTGEAKRLPAVVGVPTYQVKVEGDEVYVEMPAEEAW